MTLVAELQEGFRSNTAEARRQRLAVGRRLSRLLELIEIAEADRARARASAAAAALLHLREHARASNLAHAEAANADPHPQYQCRLHVLCRGSLFLRGSKAAGVFWVVF